MGWRDAFQDGHNDFHNKGSYTHDALAGAVGYEAVKAYEDHLAANGRPDSHAKAKEIFGGLAAAAATQLAETKGRDAWDQYQQDRAVQQVQDHFSDNVLVQEYSNNDAY